MYVRFSRNGKRYEAAQVRAAAVLLSPLVLTLVFLFVLPVALVVFMSFTNWSMATGVHDFIGLRNYKYVLGDARFWKSFGNTVSFTALKICLDTSLALLIAVFLDKRIPMRKYLRIAYFAPVVVPIAASSIIWIWFYDPGIGPFNQILAALGLPNSQWLYGEKTALLSIILFSVWKGLGYNVIIFLAGLQNIPRYLYEAAALEGASEWQMFRRITLPLLRPVMVFVLVTSVTGSFQIFDTVAVATNGGPLDSTRVIVHYIVQNAFGFFRMGYASAMSVVLGLVMLAYTILQMRIMRANENDLA